MVLRNSNKFIRCARIVTSKAPFTIRIRSKSKREPIGAEVRALSELNLFYFSTPTLTLTFIVDHKKFNHFLVLIRENRIIKLN